MDLVLDVIEDTDQFTNSDQLQKDEFNPLSPISFPKLICQSREITRVNLIRS